MLNMQNVKDIEITEGDVRTIHDKDNKLIWGRLAYDTKYAGDTEQQTYSGKNLTNFTTISFSGANNGSATREGGTFTVTSADNSANSGISFSQASLSLEPNTTYTFSAKIVSTTSSIGSAIYVSNTMMGVSSGIFGNQANAGEISTVTFTTQSTIPSNASLRLYGREEGATAVFTDLQIEKGSTATAFEPYVGGVPAPNPDYPQDINVVSGTQTVTVSDGVDSEDYTVNLGSTELCKIGDYQDYIYKSGDDWYVHKEIGKVIYDGTENWTFGTASALTVLVEIETNMQPYTTSSLCSHLVYGNTASASEDNVFNIGSSKVYAKATAITTSADSWKTWLATHNVSLYYQLATPTNTQITDTTLISQLNAIHEFLTRYGYNSSVTGNLPLIINQTSL